MRGPSIFLSQACLFVRCRDKQRKESSRLQAVNRKLTAMNKLLMEENERLQKQVSQLVHENAHMRQQLQNVSFQASLLAQSRYCSNSSVGTAFVLGWVGGLCEVKSTFMCYFVPQVSYCTSGG